MSASRGMVYLVGAGPGDPGLLTVSGLAALRSAQVLIFDRLVAPELIEEAHSGCERIDVGKQRGDAPVSQRQINELIVDRAKQGLRVVRLKGGDPFVFGRGYEELTACREAGIDCVVIPGISSAIAAPASAGIPITLRGVSRSFAVLTAETSPDTDHSIDFAQVRGVDTLILLMSRAKLPHIAATLAQSGWSPSTPVACVERATTPQQRTVCGTLGTIGRIAEEAELAAPMVTVIGEVARHAENSDFKSQTSNAGPESSQGRHTSLHGKKILITRPRSSARKLAAKLKRLGAEPIICPLVRIEIPAVNAPLDAAIARLSTYNWVAFTSRHAVTAFWRRLAAGGFDARRFAGCKLAALGFATARALRRRGIHSDLSAGSAAELADKIIENSGKNQHVLWPCGDRALPALRDKLLQAGMRIDDLVAYQTVSVKPGPTERKTAWESLDAVLVYSPSAASMLSTLELPFDRAMIVCIGPTTAEAVRAAGIRVTATAAEPSDEGMLSELSRLFATWNTGGPL